MAVRSWWIGSALLAAALFASAAGAEVAKPEAIVADGIPPIPDELAAKARPYTDARAVTLATWHPVDRSLLIATRLGETPQLHTVAKPLGMRRQISFEAEPVRSGSYAPRTGDVLLVQKDIGGNEFFQLFSLHQGQLTLLTDGKSRNVFGAWSPDGRLVGYSSTRRNGTDADLYVIDPRDASSDRMVLQRQGGGWQIRDFSADGRLALVSQTLSATHSNLFELELASGTLKPLTAPAAASVYRAPEYGADGRVWTISDERSDFQRLGTIDRMTGHFVPASGSERGEIELFDVAPDGSFVAYVLNDKGISRLKILDVATGRVRHVSALPAGYISSMDIAPWGAIAVTLTAARYPLDAFAIDPVSLGVTQWTSSETGGLDPKTNVEPELVTIKSFDGEEISGLLYRPDSARFRGKRPLIIDIHGGPEAQARPQFLFGNNFLLNELGIGIFYPNVRGSTGFGKRFLNLDNGPFKREDAVKDIGAFLAHLRADGRFDSSRIAVTGASYGGYLCYASAIHFGPMLRAAACEVAVSNIVTVLESMESYRRDLRRPEYGDERDPAQRAKLIAISPLTRAREIKIPLLVVAGGNDPRVPPSEAKQIVDAVRGNGGEVWHLLARNEGHGFYRKENDDYRFLTTLLFWRRFLVN